jgi:hypothetical protein
MINPSILQNEDIVRTFHDENLYLVTGFDLEKERVNISHVDGRDAGYQPFCMIENHWSKKI